MIRGVFRGLLEGLGWLFLIMVPALLVIPFFAPPVEEDIGAVIVQMIPFGLCLFSVGLTLVASFRGDKKRQREEEQQQQEKAKENEPRRQQEANRRAEEDHSERARHHQQQDAQRGAEEERRQREAHARRAAKDEEKRKEQERRSEDERRTRSAQEPVKDERYYAGILGLKGRVVPAHVKQKYHELAAQYHPDKVIHLGPKLREVAEEEMKAINEAYAFFRRTYDI